MSINEQIQKVLKQIEDSKIETQRHNNERVQILGYLMDFKTGYNPYHHSSVYKISSLNTDLCYIGSTTKTLEQRMNRHVWDYSTYIRGNRTFVTSFKILECEDFKIELLQSVCCENGDELLLIEGEWQRKTPNKVNIIQNGRTKKQWIEENQIKMKEYHVEYKKLNKNEINKKRMNLYYENKDEINEKSKEKYTCECGSISRIVDKSKHLKTNKHLKYINNKV